MTPRTPWTALLLLLAATGAAGRDTPELHHANGRLSVRADQVPVTTLWQGVARLLGFRLHLAEGVGDIPVSWAFKDMPTAEALAKLVVPNDFAIFYAPDPRADHVARITDLFVFPPSPPAVGGSADPPAMPAETNIPNEAQRLGRLIAGPGDVAPRRQAIADLMVLNAPDAAQGLELALAVPEPELRREVVQALGALHRDAPPTALGQVVLGDRDAQVRQEAVRVLAEIENAAARLFIEQAAQDQDENVRAAAIQALSGFRP